MFNTSRSFAALLAVSLIAIGTSAPAEARGFHAAGSRGKVGGYSRAGTYGQSAGVGGYAYGRGAAGAGAGSWAGPKGGSLNAAGGGFVTPNAGMGAGAFNAAGPNGGTAYGGATGGYKKGVGAFGSSAMHAQGANGSNYNGYKQGAYNAQTGQGGYNSGKDFYNANTGQSYGYDQSTAYQKGQGATTSLDTQNKGDYTVQWQQGAKPVVTPVAP